MNTIRNKAIVGKDRGHEVEYTYPACETLTDSRVVRLRVEIGHLTADLLPKYIIKGRLLN